MKSVIFIPCVNRDEDLVTQLLPLLLAEGVMKMSDDKIDNYENVKNYHLDHFHMDVEMYRI